MKTYLIKTLIGISCMVSITACKKYLDVKPSDKFLQYQVFSSEQGIISALNGVYLNMSSPKLYGGNLTMSTVDVLAQRYNVNQLTNAWPQFGKYNYNDPTVMSNFETIWSNSYKQILNLNIFIQQLKNSQGVISESKNQLLKGEAYGLRAMIHLDLLRLFGPVYSLTPTATSIPYYTNARVQSSGLLPANVVMGKVLADLDTAAQLLANDPIISKGTDAAYSADNRDVFYRYRNMHMNFYAVKALQARANLYAGNKDKANTLAIQVINEASKWFPWTNNGNPSSQSDDRKFSPEVIFGVQNMDIYAQYNLLFNYELGTSSFLAAHPVRLSAIFAGNDYRLIWFRIPPRNTGDPTFFKFESVITSQTDYRRFFQPLIRLSEMYYIAAETHTDPTQAFQYLNTVLNKRGVASVPLTANLQNEIQKEYVREFYGEGQLFYYYKRLGLPSIPNGSTATDNMNVDARQYVVPIPLSEGGGIN